MIPDFNEHGELPPGTHEASFAEFAARFGWNDHRQRLIAQFESALRVLGKAGVRRAYVGGSFVTGKAEPGDLDACWVPEPGHDAATLRAAFGTDQMAGAPGLHLFREDPRAWMVRWWLGRARGGREKGILLIRLPVDD